MIDCGHAIAHNKVMIIDGMTVITGSMNFTKAAEDSNAENLLVIKGGERGREVSGEFRRAREACKGVSATVNNLSSVGPIQPLCCRARYGRGMLRKHPWRFAIGGIACVLVLASIYLLIIICAFPDSWVNRGLFGDTFGAFNAVFTGLAFLGVAAALILQQGEARAHEQQSHKDQVVARFFQLITTWTSAVRDVKVDTLQGVPAVTSLENAFLGKMSHTGVWTAERGYLGELRTQLNPGEPIPLHQLEPKFRVFYEKRFGAPLGHIFRMEHAILRAIDSAIQEGLVTEGEGNRLIDDYCALMSDPDLHLLLYFGLSGFAPPGFKEQLDNRLILRGLLTKGEMFILNRIPEIKYYPKTFAEYQRLHPTDV